MATSAGANALMDMIAEEDSFVVKQLKDAGAVILAQVNMSEFAYSAIRRTPDITPALEDETLNAFLLELIDRAYAIDFSKAGRKCEGKAQVMLAACEKAKTVDTKDPCAVYEAARALAEAYDRVKAAL